MQDNSILKVLSTHKEPTHPKLSHTFYLTTELEKQEKIHAYLEEDCILLKQKKQGKDIWFKLTFHFDLVFELLREEAQKAQMGLPIALKFQRFQQTISLENKDEAQVLLLWRNLLQLKLNQRGFHQIFKPIKKIGKGNFASVYLVIKNQDKLKYAVKAFSKEATFSEQHGKQSLIKQIELMRKLKHKNLMKLYQVYQSQNSVYVSVELLQGGQLFDKIKAKHTFSQSQIKMVMKGILQGLQVMHSNGVMHRDLKPQNILLRKQGDFDCVIADFGLAQNIKEDFMFVRCGTPGYVAPEVANLKDLKAKYRTVCDLFSVGIIFHLLALKKSPFSGREYEDVLTQNRACNFNFEAPQYINLPDSWLTLMKKLLSKDPSKRITATEALNHEFFSKDEMFKDFTENRRSHIFSQDCNSPLMVSKNKDRKNKGLVRDDSCLKFKMKQNVMTGRTDENCDTVDEIDSPANLKNKPLKHPQSRFKKMTNH